MSKMNALFFIIFFGFYFSKQDDVENLTRYYLEVFKDSSLKEFIELNLKQQIVLAYGPLFYLVGMLSYFSWIPFVTLVLAPIGILYVQLLNIDNTHKSFVLFFSIPCIIYFSSSFRPDIWCLIISLAMISYSVSRKHILVGICLMLILLIKPNFIIFPIIVLLVRNHLIDIKSLIYSSLISILSWVILNEYLGYSLFLGMVQGNLNGVIWQNFYKMWSTTLGLSSLVLIVVLWFHCKFKVEFVLTFLVAMLMSLKSGSNLNYFIFPICFLVLQNTIHMRRFFMIGIMMNCWAIWELQFREIELEQITKSKEVKSSSYLTFGPTSLLSHVPVRYPDKHIWITRNSILPRCGRAILSDTSPILDLIQSDFEDYSIQVLSEHILVLWGQDEEC